MANTGDDLSTASDATIDDAVAHGDPRVLRGLLYQLTGDEDLVGVPVIGMVVGGYRRTSFIADPVDTARIRAKAAAFLKAHRDAGADRPPIGPAARLRTSLSLTAGEEVDPIELELWREELAIDPYARGLTWSGERPPAAGDFTVAIIGAGMGGLNAAALLKKAGVPFTVLEKNGDIGGTWLENRYPGARIDSASRTYAHIVGADFVFGHPFSPQPENERYFHWLADRHDLRDDIRFGTEVSTLAWDDDAGQWEITAVDAGGSRTVRANAVISAVGLLSRPNIPEIEGIGDFRGPWFHTARWPDGLDLTGRRVAVIGTGCTGYQAVPEIVERAAHVDVFQRTPNWIFEVPGYLAPFPDQVRWLDRHFPYYTNFARFHAAYLQRPQNTRHSLLIDPDFRDEHAVSRVNKTIRDQRMAFLTAKLGHRPDLLAKMTPAAPPMSARPVLVDRDHSILDVLPRDDVDLVTEPILRVIADAVETADGVRHRADVIVLATGFRANDFLWPMLIEGRGGRTVDDLWAEDGARAYLGSMLPGFPNFFMIYGPNTNVLSGMPIVGLQETVTRFALENIAALIERGHRAVDVTEDAYRRYNDEVDRAEQQMTWMDPRARNYYRNEHHRSAAMAPLDTRLLWNWLRDPAGRRAGGQVVSEDLKARYGLLDPHHGADLIVD